MNPWRPAAVLIRWTGLGFLIAGLWALACWVMEMEAAWDADQRFKDRYSRPEMWTPWTCGCGHFNKESAMCGRCGGDRPCSD